MSARFFCDNCKTQVKQNSNRCPRCGRYFASVRCPQCGFTGEEEFFNKGCPVCGYCAVKEPPSLKKQKHSFLPAVKLPLWVYITAVLSLITVLFLLLR